jgi:hypothetical protein
MPRAVPDIRPGFRLNKLTAVEQTRHPNRRGMFWICRCDCGRTTLKYAAHLRDGSAVSCGCSMAENKKTHGLSRSPEYKAWDSARGRCYREKDGKYPLYGGRGIRMCDRWRNDFAAFIADMGRRPSSAHSLDRIDSNGDYTPDNCRWATISEQNNNRSFNRHLVMDGERVTVAEASRRTGICHATILDRLDRGWSDERAVRA